MATLSGMVNGREPSGIAGRALAQLGLYQQLDSERDSLLQVSILEMMTIIAITSSLPLTLPLPQQTGPCDRG